MDRLTRRGNEKWVLINKKCERADAEDFCNYARDCNCVSNRTCPILEVLDKLCAYEDTGLTPAEIQQFVSKKEEI